MRLTDKDIRELAEEVVRTVPTLTRLETVLLHLLIVDPPGKATRGTRKPSPRPRPQRALPRFEQLTDEEDEALIFIQENMSDHRVAQHIGVTPIRAAELRMSIFTKLQVSSIAALNQVIWAEMLLREARASREADPSPRQ